MNRNTTNDQLSSTDNRAMPLSSRRRSSRISSTENSSPQRQSVIRGGISKAGVTHSARRSSKGTPRSRRKNKENYIDLPMEIEHDNNDDSYILSPSEKHEDEEQALLNISSASADTVIIGNSNNKKKLEKQPIQYFTRIDNSDKVKCSICLHVRRFFPCILLRSLI